MSKTMSQKMTIKVFVIVCVCLCVYPNTTAAQREGDPCTVNDGPGVCKLLSACPYAQDLIIGHMRKPTHCSYSGAWEVVCCPAGEIPDYALGRFGGFFSGTKNGKLVAETLSCHHDGGLPIKCCRGADRPPAPEPAGCPPPLRAVERTNQLVWNKCREYQRYVSPCVSSGGGLARVDTCAQDELAMRIAYGAAAVPGEFPHMALLGYRSGVETAWVAGGTLISDRFILTAGHVISNPKWGNVQYARLGVLRRSERGGLSFNVERRITYHGYKRTLKYHDIALLKLDRRVPLSPQIRPACLPLATTEVNVLLVTGWGRTGSSEELSDVLLKTAVKTFDGSVCRDSLDRQSLPLGWSDEQMICAGGTPQQRNDSCEGDSGGPMQTYMDDIHCMYTVVGVVSWGPECGQGAPAPYARVRSYVKWITDTIW